jgi:SAM-dependent methyltransferase
VNQDKKVVSGFGEEWSRFSQEALSSAEGVDIFKDYFADFPWDALPDCSVGADVGCGSGRWAKFVATQPKVAKLICIDASSEALTVARRNLSGFDTVVFREADLDHSGVTNGSLDFAYSLGVLHHVPDTFGALVSISKVLKRGAPFLVYLYYAFDNRPLWYRLIWKLSDTVRRIVSVMPSKVRFLITDAIAITVYWPLARGAFVIHKLGFPVSYLPLSYYRDKSLYVMRTDALDRFGTRLEKRFTKLQILEMLENAGFTDIKFSDTQPFWCASARKK